MAKVFACGPKDAEFAIDVNGDVVSMSLDGVTLLGEQQAAIADAAAATASAFPAGGTGAAAGGWDTAVNRDAAIAEFAALLVDVADIRTQLNLVIAALEAHGLIAS